MNEKLQYASMLEIPVSTCNITYKPIRRKNAKRKKNISEDVKTKLLEKVNSESIEEEKNEQENVVENIDEKSLKNLEQEIKLQEIKEQPKKKEKGGAIIAIELAVLGVLIATIFLTNAFFSGSVINTFFNGVFKSPNITTEEEIKTYSDFAPVISFGDSTLQTIIEDGVMKISGEGSVYSPFDGRVSKVAMDGNGKYSMEITFTEKFKTVLSGLDFAYLAQGDKVYGNIPVGYVSGEQFSMCFTGENDAIITNYTLSDNQVVWEV